MLALGFGLCIHCLWLLILWFRPYGEEPFSNAKKVPPKGLAPPSGLASARLPSLRRRSGGRRERPSLAAHGFLGILASLPPAQRLRSALMVLRGLFNEGPAGQLYTSQHQKPDSIHPSSPDRPRPVGVRLFCEEYDPACQAIGMISPPLARLFCSQKPQSL